MGVEHDLTVPSSPVAMTELTENMVECNGLKGSFVGCSRFDCVSVCVSVCISVCVYTKATIVYHLIVSFFSLYLPISLSYRLTSGQHSESVQNSF